jgi:hypothetical protein
VAKIEDRDWRIIAAAAYQTQREAFHAAARLQGQYGTWLVATGTATQAAAIYVTANLADVPVEARLPAIAVFLVGLLLMMVAGLVAYLNCNLHMALYARWSNALMLVDGDGWPKPDPKLSYRINLTYILALEFGIFSVLCLPIGAARLMMALGLKLI